MTKLHHKRLYKKHTHRPTIALIYHAFENITNKTNAQLKETQYIDEDTEHTVEYIRKALKKHAYTVQIVKITKDDLSPISKIKADYIFNLVDSKALEIKVASILERLQIPYSGSSSTAIRNGNNKIKAKSLFEKYYIPTPQYSVIEPGTKLSRSHIPGKSPLIVKPAFEHGSVGISDKSVITSYKQLQKIIQLSRKKLKQSLICEKFIKGKEIQIMVLEAHGQTIALPPAEMIFKNGVKTKWNIYGYTEKWRQNRKLFKNCSFIAPPLQISDHIIHKMQRDAICAFYAFGFRDFARFDLRYHTETKQWFFLEGNPNPGLSILPNEASAVLIKAQGMTFADFILTIIHNSIPKP